MVDKNTAQKLVMDNLADIRGMVAMTCGRHGALLGPTFVEDCKADCVLALLADKAQAFDPSRGIKATTFLCTCAHNFTLDALRHSAHVEKGGYNTIETMDDDRQDWRTVALMATAIKVQVAGKRVDPMADSDDEDEHAMIVEILASNMGKEWRDLLSLVADAHAWAKNHKKTIGHARVTKHRLLAKARGLFAELTK